MKSYENHRSQFANHMPKWMTVGVMQRADLLQCVAEMFSLYMEDIYDLLTTIESNMEEMQGGIENIQSEIEDLSCFVETHADPEQHKPNNSFIETEKPLPF